MKENKVIQDIERYLTERYGKVNDEWRLTLSLLKDNLTLYSMCMKSIKENGIYDSSTQKKNPLLSTVKDIQATMIKQIQHLGLTPYAASKIKDLVEDDDDDFLESLTTNY